MTDALAADQTEAYLARIGVTGRLVANAATLARLHLAHLTTVPFENLDIPLGRRLDLDPSALFDKIVRRRRGGFCYELNRLFARLLRALGYKVTLLSARVCRDDGSFGQEFDHMTLRVDLEEPFLADVGFGDAFLQPLRLKSEVEQHDKDKVCKLIQDAGIWVYCERAGDGAFRPQYRFTLTSRQPEEFEEMCVWQQTASESHFVRNLVCTRASENGRMTVSGGRFIDTKNGQRRTREIATEEELRTILEERFGITGIDRGLLPPR